MSLMSIKTVNLLRIASSFLLLAFAPLSFAQFVDIEGEWHGTYNINIGGDRDVVFTITVGENGELSGTFDDHGTGALGLTLETVTLEGREVHFTVPLLRGEYFGTVHSDLGRDGKPLRIDGDWIQAGEFIPITLQRKQ